tara:strand:- start:6701 stop:8902 length:2202 start_codon:yes stop_codon:yes gene_type:complete
MNAHKTPYRYIKNLRQHEVFVFNDPLSVNALIPNSLSKKADVRAWSADPKTDYVFYSLYEGDNPNARIVEDNPIRFMHGFIADYDAPVNWSDIDDTLKKRCMGSHMPTWRSETPSGYARLVWEFEKPFPIDPRLADTFIRDLSGMLQANRLLAGFDNTSLKTTQHFAFGTNWVKTGGKIPAVDLHQILFKSANRTPISSGETNIPIGDVAKEVEARFGNRWSGPFEVGSRGPLFWIDDGIERDGCQVRENGMVCYSDRAGKGFVSWGEIFGKKWVEQYEERKIGSLYEHFWFNGTKYFKLLNEKPVIIPKEQLTLELRRLGFSAKAKKGENLSEVESAILTISDQCRVDEIAPVVFSKNRIVEYNGYRILNNRQAHPVSPAQCGDKENWPWLHGFITNFYADDSSGKSTLPYFLAWWRRFFVSVAECKAFQGHMLISTGPAGHGKTLMGEKVVGGSVGGFADASTYLVGATQFTKELAGSALWLIDDAIAAATYTDQRRFVELSKRAVANPRMEYQAKYADALSIPWTGRVMMSLNIDPNSMAALPTLDSSNRDKVMALRVNDKYKHQFGTNEEVEEVIEKELPYFLHYLINQFKAPDYIRDVSRFGVKSYIDPTIEAAAFDNSNRSTIGELVDFFAKRVREAYPEMENWHGTLTQFQSLLQEVNGGRNIGSSGDLEFVRRGMLVLEETCQHNKNVRPVKSVGHGGGKTWLIDLSVNYDLGGIKPVKEETCNV